MNVQNIDSELLQAYASRADEAAFAELVRRHLDLVYSAARRQLHGDDEAAKDVTQAVFCDLARKAARLPQDMVLAGWLHRHTGFLAANFIRSNQRRHLREREAMHVQEVNRDNPAEWEAIAPVLDAALKELPEPDQDALVLRYFENQPLREIGAAMATSEEAARKRIDRALDRLRTRLVARGVSSTSSALAATLLGNAVSPAPVDLVGAVTSAAAVTSSSGIVLGLIYRPGWRVATAAVALSGWLALWWVNHKAGRRLHALESAHSLSLAERDQAVRDLTDQAARDREKLTQFQADQLELLRLRGEVARLRRSTGAQATQVTAETPAVDSAVRPARVTIEAKFIWSTDQAWEAVDLPSVPVGGPLRIGEAERSRVLEHLAAGRGLSLLESQNVTTLSGRQASIGAIEMTELAGQRFETGPVLEATPVLLETGEIELRFLVRIKFREPLPVEGEPLPMLRLPSGTVFTSGSIGRGEALVMRQRLSAEQHRALIETNPRKATSTHPSSGPYSVWVLITAVEVDDTGTPVLSGPGIEKADPQAPTPSL